MKTTKRVKEGCALVLAVSLALPCLSLMQTRAAGAIEVERPCSLTVSIEKNVFLDRSVTVEPDGQDTPSESGGQGTTVQKKPVYVESDFPDMTIPVSLYKVASVDNVGNYTAEGAFEAMDFSGISSEMTADEWLAKAEEAAGYAETIKDPEQIMTQEVKGAEGMTTASTKFEGLATGMYLVVPAPAYNRDYTILYTFIPYLTPLPGNPYASAGYGEDDGYGQGTDEWVYDTTVGLKPEGEKQFGKLDITKILDNYNETLGQTSFVFQIEGRSENGDHYSNVIETTHSGPGSQTVTLDRIPAGMTVTITEVYSGASYTIVGTDSDSALIWSDAAVGAGREDQASVEFHNEYGGGNRGGYGVTNHFEADGEDGWIWNNPTTPLEE